ncbi:MDR/zinc-dependent alcohol dehydrogenase-like family protein [Novacetimonas hansenii]|nr:hypothetical protein [Novacetimonas hansenii]GBQ59966.1 hypothetical protein AA0243_2194 [Novacetimonas hansenii NRIC 0243]
MTRVSHIPNIIRMRWLGAPDRLEDLTDFTRDLMTRMEADLGTRLDWVAVILAQLALRRNWRVWVTASPVHRERLLALGIAGTFDYRDEGWRAQLTAALGPRRLFAVFDTTSGAYARGLAPLVGYNGHLVCIQDRLESPPLSPFTTALSLHEVALNSAHGHATAEDWREWRQAGAQLLDAVRIGAIGLQQHIVSAFDDLPASLSALKHGRIKGQKILVRIEA